MAVGSDSSADPPDTLAGIRVLDLSRHLPGPTCTWLLQGLGAEVTKVERPGEGDPVRHLPPFGKDGVSAWYSALNAGKRSVALDLRTQLGRAAVEALVAESDVVVESFRPGWLARVGLDPAAWCKRKPELVVASISSYGQQGAWSDRPGHDLNFAALSGQLALNQDAGASLPAMQWVDFAAGQSAALRVVAALFAVARGGPGQWIDAAIADAALALVSLPLAATAEGGKPSKGRDALNGGAANYRLYRCADGRSIAFAALEPRLWQAFEEAVGQHVEADMRSLSALFAQHPREYWAELLAGAGVAPVLDPREVLEHPYFDLRGTLVGEGAARRVASWADAHAELRTAKLGEHTEAELERLGLVDRDEALNRPEQVVERSS